MSKTPRNRVPVLALGALLVPIVGLGCVGPTHRSTAALTPEEREVLARSVARIERDRRERGEVATVAPRDLSAELETPAEPAVAPREAETGQPRRDETGQPRRSERRPPPEDPAVQAVPVRQPGPRPEPTTAPTPSEPTNPPTPATTLGVLQGRVSGVSSTGGAPLVVLAIPIGRATEHSKGTTTLIRGEEGFEPPFLVVPIGETIRFQNDDEICHSFFSSSPNHEFELGLIDPETSMTYRVEQPGTVQVYCSLHSGKQASIFAVPTPHFGVVAEDGVYDLGRLESGEYQVMLWSDGAVLQRHEVVVVPGARTLWNAGTQALAPSSEAR